MEKQFFKRLNLDESVCLICNHFCKISNGSTGKCGVRKNINGEIVSLVKNLVAAEGIDPIEKKPLFHVLPGSLSYSIAASGCNFSCKFCQNADLAQSPALYSQIYGMKKEPSDIAKEAFLKGCSSISYTYSEPTVFFELMRDTAKEAKKRGLLNLMVSNGFMSFHLIEEIKDLIDAANIDLKSFNPEFYKTICGGRLEPVLKNLIKLKKSGVFLEITTLLIPGKNDSPEEIDKLTDFIKNELGDDTPWHVSAFYPTFKMTDIPPTPPSSVMNAIEIGKQKGLKYIYSGNIRSNENESTFCPACKNKLVERKGFYVIENRIKNGKCIDCGEQINGIFK